MQRIQRKICSYQMDDFRLYVFAPVKDGLAVIGDGSKFISPAAIQEQDGENITLYEDGDLIVYKV